MRKSVPNHYGAGTELYALIILTNCPSENETVKGGFSDD